MGRAAWLLPVGGQRGPGRKRHRPAAARTGPAARGLVPAGPAGAGAAAHAYGRAGGFRPGWRRHTAAQRGHVSARQHRFPRARGEGLAGAEPGRPAGGLRPPAGHAFPGDGGRGAAQPAATGQPVQRAHPRLRRDHVEGLPHEQCGGTPGGGGTGASARRRALAAAAAGRRRGGGRGQRRAGLSARPVEGDRSAAVRGDEPGRLADVGAGQPRSAGGCTCVSPRRPASRRRCSARRPRRAHPSSGYSPAT